MTVGDHRIYSYNVEVLAEAQLEIKRELIQIQSYVTAKFSKSSAKPQY